jgi:protein-tyrosine kinase
MRRGGRASSFNSEAPGPRNWHGHRSRTASGAGARPARFETEMLALRARLAPLLEERRNVVIGVTSCGPEEGVTTISRELSRVLATEEMEVLLCGPCGDLSTSSNSSGADRKITRTVVPHLSFAEINDLHRVNCDRRSILAFRAWLERVKSNYAVTILDTPPILELGGWETLFRLEDGLLLMVEAERTRTSVIRATLDTIEGAGGNVLGIVFNCRRWIIPEMVYRWL